jgi:hypothetical protein
MYFLRLNPILQLELNLEKLVELSLLENYTRGLKWI